MLNRRLLLGLIAMLTAGSAFADPWVDSLRAARAKDDSLLAHSPLSAFAAIGQAVLQPNKPLRVVLSADTLLLGHASADPGLPQLEFFWLPEQGVVHVRSPLGGDFHVNNQPVGPVPRILVASDTVFAENFLLKAYASHENARVRAFKPGGAGQSAFHGLTYYEPDPAFRVAAHLERSSQPDTVTMPTSAGLKQHYLRYGRLRFVIDGNPAELTLFVPANDPEAYGFLPFTDASSGGETYGGGRYIDLELPTADQDTLVIDFNSAYNPLCAYVPHYNCPIPPAENALKLEIRAGEKAYAKH